MDKPKIPLKVSFEKIDGSIEPQKTDAIRTVGSRGILIILFKFRTRTGFLILSSKFEETGTLIVFIPSPVR